MTPGAVYPRASALVCHGGSGTILAGLAHGLPMVLTPLAADQPDNARRVEATGAGITVGQPDAASLASAIERILADPAMRAAAGRVAAEMAAMHSIDDAVAAFEQLASRNAIAASGVATR